MAELFSVSGLFTLGMLVLLQAVLGFDNLLYLSIESKRVEADKQAMVRKLGIMLAVLFRIGLLMVIVNLIRLLEEPFFELHNNIFDAEVSGHSLIVLFGGAFILWTAVKEIYHLLAEPDLTEGESKQPASVAKTVGLIVVMNLIFSFDSILSAMALSDNLWIMSTAIIIGGILMIVLADKVASFLAKNRMYEVLGLFILFIVGVMLVSEGGHLAHIRLFTYHVEPMTKTTFYFVLGVLIIVDVVQSRYQKRLLAKQEARAGLGEQTADAA
ncbi:MAG: TerC family protein [Planctomycetota bacterium]